MHLCGFLSSDCCFTHRVYVLGAKTSEKVYGDTVLEEMDDDQKEKRQEKMDSLRKKLHGARHHAIKELRLVRATDPLYTLRVRGL